MHNMRQLHARLDALYNRFNHTRYLHPDPLETVYWFTSPADREVAGLIAACLAFGNVQQILRSLESLFQIMAAPHAFLMGESEQGVRRAVHGFRHRYVDETDLGHLLIGVRRAVQTHGSLEACFAAGLAGGNDAGGALHSFVQALRAPDPRPGNYLLPDPARGSACKRLHLYLRWMVRRDAIDPGVWRHFSPAELIVPVDTHMHRIAVALGLTRRKSGDARTAREITQAFRGIAPDDPVRYDFALTRLGIRRDEEARSIAARFLPPPPRSPSLR